MKSNHNSQQSKVLRISSVTGVEYAELSSDWGTEYSLTACAPRANATDVRYLDTIELDGRDYTLIRFRGNWDVIR